MEILEELFTMDIHIKAPCGLGSIVE